MGMRDNAISIFKEQRELTDEEMQAYKDMLRRKEKRMTAEICTDNRFVIIDRAKEDLIKSTNIESSHEEMKVIDNILFRDWQMGWLDRYKDLALDEAKEFNDMLERAFTETPIIEAERRADDLH